jgi:formylglycine-generating enzyme required for sulfatase activity
MVGNIWEWVSSLWGRYDRERPEKYTNLVFDPLFTYPYRPDDGRENLTADMWWLRVERGGGWNNAQLRCTSRNRRYPNYSFNVVGFRVCMSGDP